MRRFRDRRSGKLEPDVSTRRKICGCGHVETSHENDGDRLCRFRVADRDNPKNPSAIARCSCKGFRGIG